MSFPTTTQPHARQTTRMPVRVWFLYPTAPNLPFPAHARCREWGVKRRCRAPLHLMIFQQPSRMHSARTPSTSSRTRAREPSSTNMSSLDADIRADPRFRIPTGMTACTPTRSAIAAETTDRSPPTPAAEDTAAAPAVSEQPQKAPPTAAPTTTTRRLLTTRRQGGGREARRYPDAQHGLARYASS